MKEREIVELEIESIAFPGQSIARLDGVVHFIKGGLPGDTVIAEIIRKKKKHKEGVVKEIIKSSPHRVEAVCSHFGVCGGCTWQNLKYTEQLVWKKRHVEDSFRHLTKIEVGLFNDTVPSVRVFNYRNKMDFSFSAERWLTDEEVKYGDDSIKKDFALGLHSPGRFDKSIDIKECHIQVSEGNPLLTDVRELALSLGVSAYHMRQHVGFLRSLIIRSSANRKELMVILTTSAIREEKEKQFIARLTELIQSEHKHVSTLIHAINDSLSPVKIEEMTTIFGSGYITERILGIDYRISPFSFFQTNSSQLDRFIGEIIDQADLKAHEIVWDLYCGAGSITLPASRKCKKIYGLELVQESIDDAKNNAVMNGIENAEFICTDLHSKGTNEIIESLPKPDTIIIDPPRAGMHKHLIDHVLAADADRIVYVSCNPTTQARDCELLSENYNVESVTPVDMFPHTFHIESIALLTKKKA